ncbi:VanZ family protein [Mesobacillus jeotgali]|uniref:VanZ family protein n=1 Tax=Mesobacillus jeotgali TaxID=129985 RepID=UPI001CFDA372|nr:VanZ family protein [Mesobacillus jeotgali]
MCFLFIFYSTTEVVTRSTDYLCIPLVRLIVKRVVGLLDFHMIFGLDKLMHFIGFLGASSLIGIFVLIFSGPNNVKHTLKVVWFSLVTIGIIEEYRQFLDPGRSTEFLDAVANIAGVNMGIGITLGFAYLVVNKHRIFSSVFRLYPMFLMMLLLGLLYLNERPFIKMDVSFQERVRSLAALIGF